MHFLSWIKAVLFISLLLLPFGLWGQAAPAPRPATSPAPGTTQSTPAPKTQTSPLGMRIKDIVQVEGLRENILTGIGVVTGLAGQGDSSSNSMLQFALSSLAANMGITVEQKDIKSKNAAVVTVTSTLGTVVSPGQNIDLQVSSLGDAKSLEGGVLLQTPLLGANGKTYATAQGRILLNLGKGGVKTSGNIPQGGVVEKGLTSDFIQDGKVTLILNRPDFATAQAIVEAVKTIGLTAQAADPGRVQITLQDKDKGVETLSKVENLTITPQDSSLVVINRSSGVVVAGGNVRIAKVAVSVRGTKITVGKPVAPQGAASPAPKTGSSSTKAEQFLVPDSASVEDLVALLQQLGLTTDQLIDVLRAIDETGALYGTLVVVEK